MYLCFNFNWKKKKNIYLKNLKKKKKKKGKKYEVTYRH